MTPSSDVALKIIDLARNDSSPDVRKLAISAITEIASIRKELLSAIKSNNLRLSATDSQWIGEIDNVTEFNLRNIPFFAWKGILFSRIAKSGLVIQYKVYIAYMWSLFLIVIMWGFLGNRITFHQSEILEYLFFCGTFCGTFALFTAITAIGEALSSTRTVKAVVTCISWFVAARLLINIYGGTPILAFSAFFQALLLLIGEMLFGGLDDKKRILRIVGFVIFIDFVFLVFLAPIFRWNLVGAALSILFILPQKYAEWVLLGKKNSPNPVRVFTVPKLKESELNTLVNMALHDPNEEVMHLAQQHIGELQSEDDRQYVFELIKASWVGEIQKAKLLAMLETQYSLPVFIFNEYIIKELFFERGLNLERFSKQFPVQEIKLLLIGLLAVLFLHLISVKIAVVLVYFMSLMLASGYFFVFIERISPNSKTADSAILSIKIIVTYNVAAFCMVGDSYLALTTSVVGVYCLLSLFCRRVKRVSVYLKWLFLPLAVSIFSVPFLYRFNALDYGYVVVIICFMVLSINTIKSCSKRAGDLVLTMAVSVLVSVALYAFPCLYSNYDEPGVYLVASVFMGLVFGIALWALYSLMLCIGKNAGNFVNSSILVALAMAISEGYHIFSRRMDLEIIFSNQIIFLHLIWIPVAYFLVASLWVERLPSRRSVLNFFLVIASALFTRLALLSFAGQDPWSLVALLVYVVFGVALFYVMGFTLMKYPRSVFWEIVRGATKGLGTIAIIGYPIYTIFAEDLDYGLFMLFAVESMFVVVFMFMGIHLEKQLTSKGWLLGAFLGGIVPILYFEDRRILLWNVVTFVISMMLIKFITLRREKWDLPSTDKKEGTEGGFA